MPTHETDRALAAQREAHEQVLRALMAQIERTYATEGSHRAFQQVAEMLGRMDPATLRSMALERGAMVEEEELEGRVVKEAE